LLQRRAWRGPDWSGRTIRAAPKAGLDQLDLAGVTTRRQRWLLLPYAARWLDCAIRRAGDRVG
jgi:hypothetical protein